MSTTALWVTILGIAFGSLLLRAAFIVFPLMRGELTTSTRFVLELVPPAAFAALVAPAVLMPNDALTLLTLAPMAADVTLLVSIKGHNLALSIAGGLATYALIDVVMG